MGKKEKSRKRSERSESEDSGNSGSEAERRKKHKKEKKHKKHKDRSKDEDDDMVKQAKAFLKAQLAGQAHAAPTSVTAQPSTHLPAPTLPEDKRITEDDYFAKSAEFTAWLQEHKKLYFNELTTEQTHGLFKEFAAGWNANQLPAQYYAGTIAPPVKRTSHQWNFKGGTGITTRPAEAKGMTAFLSDQTDKAKAGRLAERVEQKRWRGEQKELLDELLPKATGREAVIEKRIARREDAKAREPSPDGLRVPGGGDVYGADDDSFAAAKAREAKRAEMFRHRNVARAEVAVSTVAAIQAKEDERMAQFSALAAQGPIVIPKRQH